MAKEKQVIKSKEKTYTRAHAEKLLASGSEPALFAKHGNYHVRCKAWKKMGCPLPEGSDELVKFLATLQGKPIPKDEPALTDFWQSLRVKFLPVATA